MGVLPTARAQDTAYETLDFPDSMPGQAVVHPGGSCMMIASGRLEAGDVDWIQLVIPFASDRTVIDVDFEAGAATPGGSLLLASVVGGSTAFNNNDGNSSNDNLCGLGGLSFPAGSSEDSVGGVGATAENAVVNIAVTGSGDSGFSGRHSAEFDYEIWAYVEGGPAGCLDDSDCDDGVDCTIDECNTATGECSSFADPSYCDDGSFCNGPEVCDVEVGCVDGVPPNCDDGLDCTVDTCDDEFAECVHTADDSVCDDGSFCNGVELCDAFEGCLAGESPCGAGEVCDDEADECYSASVAAVLDIRPGSCPNPLNARSRGVVSMALVGTTEFDPADVDVNSLLLTMDDLDVGVSPVSRRGNGPHLEDVAGASSDEACACTETSPDGLDDLMMRFNTTELVFYFGLDLLAHGETAELVLVGELMDGTPFEARDCVKMVGGGR